MTNYRMMFTGFAALATVAAAGAITTASAAPGDGPHELRAKVTEKQWALPRAVGPTMVETNTTRAQAINIAQAATRGFATAATMESRPDGQVVVVDIQKNGVRSEVVVNRHSSKIERVTLADLDVKGEAID